jgi:hypothetical protein
MDSRGIAVRFARSFAIWFLVADIAIIWKLPLTIPSRPWVHGALLIAILWPNAIFMGYIPSGMNPWLLGLRRHVTAAARRVLLVDALAFIAAFSVPVLGAGISLLWRNSWYVALDSVLGLLLGGLYMLRRQRIVTFALHDVPE